MLNGWIKLQRKIIDHWVFSDAKYFRAWVYCLCKANHLEKTVMIKGELIKVDRGEFVTSLNSFSKDNEMTVQQTRTFFSLLQKDKMIRKNPTRQATKLTICNYESYNDIQQSNQQADNTPPTHGQQRMKNDKNDKNTIYGYFEFFWKTYHDASGIQETDKESCKRIWNDMTKDERKKATDKIMLYVKSRNPQYIKKAKNYLFDKNYNDDLNQKTKSYTIPITAN